jgi:hypothetical protein
MSTSKSVIATIIFLVMLGAISGQDPHECVRAKAPSIDNNLAHLQYDSRITPVDVADRFLFDRCVLNHRKATKIYIDWVGTGAKGISNAEGLVRGGIESPTKDHEEKNTDLVYGIGRNKQPSKYKEVKAAQANDPTLPGSLRSYAKMGLPMGGREEQPNFVVVDIDVEFESAAMKLGNGSYLYTYSWRDRLAPKRGSEHKIFIAWPDEFVAQAVSQGGKFPNELLSASSHGGYATAKAPPTFEMVTVRFHSTDKKTETLGTARVSILRPKDGKR